MAGLLSVTNAAARGAVSNEVAGSVHSVVDRERGIADRYVVTTDVCGSSDGAASRVTHVHHPVSSPMYRISSVRTPKQAAPLVLRIGNSYNVSQLPRTGIAVRVQR